MLQRITLNPKQMGGVPCIRGLRVPVATVVAMVADGMTVDEILEAYPDLESEDISEALQFSAEDVKLEQRGIDTQHAADLRRRLAAFAEDWENPDMDVYDRPDTPNP